MAHEIGHNLGADHAKYKGFIMSISDSLNEVNFSPVTVDVLQTNLDFVRKTRNCFNMEYIETFSVCGNGKIEGDEECDCGLSYESCQDPCCYAAQISSEDLTLNASATPCRRHTQPRCYQEPPTRFK